MRKGSALHEKCLIFTLTCPMYIVVIVSVLASQIDRSHFRVGVHCVHRVHHGDHFVANQRSKFILVLVVRQEIRTSEVRLDDSFHDEIFKAVSIRSAPQLSTPQLGLVLSSLPHSKWLPSFIVSATPRYVRTYSAICNAQFPNPTRPRHLIPV